VKDIRSATNAGDDNVNGSEFEAIPDESVAVILPDPRRDHDVPEIVAEL
jgi:hypothetical protein